MAATLCVLPGVAEASTDGRVVRVSPNVGQPVGSSRALVYRPREGVVRFLLRKGSSTIAVDPSCMPYDVRGTLALVDCVRADSGPAYYARPGAAGLQPVTGWQPGDLYFGLGRYWLVGDHCSDPRNCDPVSLDRRTGRRLPRLVDENRATPHDPPEGWTTWPRPGGGPWDHPGNRLLLVRRDGHRETLSRCRSGCFDVTLRQGILLWREGARRLFAYDADRRRTTRFRVPRGRVLGVDGIALGGIWFTARRSSEPPQVLGALYRGRAPAAQPSAEGPSTRMRRTVR